MYQKALTTYYGLSLFVVATAAFTIHPSSNSELTTWQHGIREQFNRAFVQVIGDQPMFTEIGLVFDGVSDFYGQSSHAIVSLISSPDADADIYYVYNSVYGAFSSAVKLQNTGSVAGIAYEGVELPPAPLNFMQEEPLYNLIPYKTVVKTVSEGTVAGNNYSIDEPVNSEAYPWITVKDNLTGQLYCLAVYNGAVNQYLGPCKYDYH